MDAGTGGDDVNANGICFPYDVLLHILRLLPTRALAGSRRVCRAWRAIVDAHDLLFPHYFPPGAFPGIFVTKVGCHSNSAFFAPPATRGRGRAIHVPGFQSPIFRRGRSAVSHSCNGLLLLDGVYVCNPATARCSDRLPCPPTTSTRRSGAKFLAFDPAVSLHYQVFSFMEEVLLPPRFVPDKPTTQVDVELNKPHGPELPAWVDLHQPCLFTLFGEEELFEEEHEQDDGSMDMEQACSPKSFEQGNEIFLSGLFGEEKSLELLPSPSDMLVEESLYERPYNGEVAPPEQPQVERLEEETKEKVVPFIVYSSHTAEWENREFTPGRCAPGHLYDSLTTFHGSMKTVWSSEYWRGSLYMHCHKSILMILRPSKGTYDMVELPGEPCHPKDRYSLPTNDVLASYERGIHYVAINRLELRVWMLSEWTDGQLGWTLAHEANLIPQCHMVRPLAIQPRVTWDLLENNDDNLFGERKCRQKICEDDTTDDENNDDSEEEDEAEAEELDSKSCSENSWNSDEDNFIEVAEGDSHLGPPAWRDDCEIMGFDPHKHVLILLLRGVVVACHLDASRMQYLGEEYKLIKDHEQQACFVYGSFPYRPCYRDVLPTRKSPASA